MCWPSLPLPQPAQPSESIEATEHATGGPVPGHEAKLESSPSGLKPWLRRIHMQRHESVPQGNSGQQADKLGVLRGVLTSMVVLVRFLSMAAPWPRSIASTSDRGPDSQVPTAETGFDWIQP